jgi:hypothetical protein
MWFVIVEYAGIVAAISLLAATLTGAYGNNVAAVFASSGASVAAVTKAAQKERVSTAGAKAAYKRAPYAKPALKYLFALGWIGGTKNMSQCGLMLLGTEGVHAAPDPEQREADDAAQEARDHREDGGVGTRRGRRLGLRLTHGRPMRWERAVW